MCAVSMTSATQNIKAKFNPDCAYFKQREIGQTDDTGLSQEWWKTKSLKKPKLFLVEFYG